MTCYASPTENFKTGTVVMNLDQSKAKIVGRWQTKVQGSDIYMYYDFYQNGTGKLSNSVNDEYFTFRWSLNGKTIYMVQTNGDDDEIYEAKILSLDNYNMVLEDVLTGEKIFLTRK
jgi:hypothetical protein